MCCPRPAVAEAAAGIDAAVAEQAEIAAGVVVAERVLAAAAERATAHAAGGCHCELILLEGVTGLSIHGVSYVLLGRLAGGSVGVEGTTTATLLVYQRAKPAST